MTVRTRLNPSAFRAIDNRLLLLMGQSLSLGTLLSLLIITASALFLTRFGSQTLPYVYIAVAILGSLVFYGYAELQSRFPLPALSKTTIASIAVFFAFTWLGLTFSDAGWIIFLLMVSFSLIIQMGFVLLGNQAGRLFDVRELKSKFPRVVAGFAIGFLLGGIIASLLANIVGRTENLLLLAILFSLSMLAFLLLTDRRYHAKLIHAGIIQSHQPSKPLWQMLAKRFVLLVVLYQMLSAMVSQLLDFMLFDQAAVRYVGSLEMAEFLGNYTIVVNLSDILFLAFFAGLLLSRFGLKFGMAANPVIDLLLLVVEVVVGVVLGVDSSLFFILVMAARIIDITLTDGTTRGSVNTAYQALPVEERIAVQTGVEGIGVPVALGLTGVFLLVFNTINGLTILHVAIFTLIVGFVWSVSAFLAYQGYAGSLVQTLRRRALDPATLSLDDSSSLAVVKGFLVKGNLNEVRLALDMLQDAQHESLNNSLITLVSHQQRDVRAEALSRIGSLKIATALPTIRACLETEWDPQAIGAALQALCALEGSAVVDQVKAYLTDQSFDVQYGAAVGLLRYCENPGLEAGTGYLSSLLHSPEPSRRQLAAQIVGGVESSRYFQPLVDLLSDETMDVRCAALVAAGRIKNPILIPQTIDNLALPSTRSAAMTALVDYGELVLPHVESALTKKDSGDANQTVRLVRAAGQIPGDNVTTLLLKHLDHPHGEIRSALLAVLSSAGYQADPEDVLSIKAAMQAEARDAVRLLDVSLEMADIEAAGPLRKAISDELANVRQRISYLLTYLYDRQAILKAFERLNSGSGAQQSLALETLDVMLPTDVRRFVLPLADKRLDTEEQLQQLANFHSSMPQNGEPRFLELLTGKESPWHHFWIRTCAIYTVTNLGLTEMAEAIELSLSATEAPLRETAIWSLHKLDRKRFEANIAKMIVDPNPVVARMASALVSRVV